MFGLIISFFICGLTYSLRWIDSIPLRRLVSLEDSLFDEITGKRGLKRLYAHSIIFVDIDDRSLIDFSGGASNFGETPRILVARLIERVAKAHAFAVYVDLDMRSQNPDMPAVLEAIRHADGTKILVPSFLSGGLTSSCGQGAGHMPRELLSPFDDVVDSGKALAVHSIVMTGPYAFIEGTCSSYKVIDASGGQVKDIQAAMPQALMIDQDGPARMIPMQLYAGLADEVLKDGDKLIYAHVSAHELNSMKPEQISDRMSNFDQAIVIIGSSHLASGDEQPTSSGDIPGALIQANIAIGLNTQHEASMSWFKQFGLDIILATLGATLSVFVYRFVKGNATRPFIDFVITIGVGVFAFMTCVWVQSFESGLLASWRFGLLTCLTTAVAFLVISLVSGLAERLASCFAGFLDRNIR